MSLHSFRVGPSNGREGSQGAQTSMQAEDAIVDNRGKGEPVEHGVESPPNPLAVFLPQPIDAFSPIPKNRVHVLGLQSP